MATLDLPPLLDNLVIATCCRDWPVTPFARIFRCGYCGERPQVDFMADVDEIRPK